MGIVVSQAVDDLLRATPAGVEALRVVEANNITINKKTDGPPAYFVEDKKKNTKVIVINTSLPAQEIAYYFCHEAHHARQNFAGASGDANVQDKASFVETMVNEETIGSAIGFEFLEELKKAGRPIATPVPFRYDMYADFVARKRTALASDHPDWTEEKLNAAVTAFGRRYVRALINDGFLRPTALHLYAEFYTREWLRAQEAKKSADAPSKKGITGAPRGRTEA